MLLSPCNGCIISCYCRNRKKACGYCMHIHGVTMKVEESAKWSTFRPNILRCIQYIHICLLLLFLPLMMYTLPSVMSSRASAVRNKYKNKWISFFFFFDILPISQSCPVFTTRSSITKQKNATKAYLKKVSFRKTLVQGKKLGACSVLKTTKRKQLEDTCVPKISAETVCDTVIQHTSSSKVKAPFTRNLRCPRTAMQNF